MLKEKVLNVYRQKGECIRGIFLRNRIGNELGESVCKVQVEISGHDINQKC